MLLYSSSPWGDTLTIPAYTSAFSLLVLLANATYARLKKHKNTTGDEELSTVYSVRDHVTSLGGFNIILYKLVRLLACLALLGLSVTTLATRTYSSTQLIPQVAIITTYGYASILALYSLSNSRSQAQTATNHLVFALLVTWGVFLYRDIWPLATFTLQPKDYAEGLILWVKIGVLSLAAVIVPLFVPKPYIPVDTEDPCPEPNPEDTASWFSFLNFTYLDRVVLAGIKSSHLEPEKLPSLSDRDAMKTLSKKSDRYLDPLGEGGSKLHIFWGLIRVFWVEHVILVLTVFVLVFASFIAPISVNRILDYLERNDEQPFVRPWVWVFGLFCGPLMNSILVQLYNFYATRSIVQVQGIITQLVFDHALRIRLKSEASDSSSTVSARNSGANTPDDRSIAGSTSNADDNLQGDEHSTTSTAASTSGTVKKDDRAEEATAETKKSNLVGKINNLVTADLATLQDGQTFVLLFFFTPSQIIVSTVFLHKLLGWSALVGIGTMFVLIFIPGYLSARLQKIQGEKMKKSDARVQAVTESMGGVIRMIKLFGWEHRMGLQIDEKRQAELKIVRKFKLITMIATQLNTLIPIITMIVTYTIYTTVMKGQLSASRVFSSMAVFQTLQMHLRGCFWSVPPVIRAKVSLDRINEFLKKTELLDVFQAKDTPLGEGPIFDTVSELDFVGIREASFTWDGSSSGTTTPGGRRKFKLMIEDEVIFKRGCINLVIGKTGVGKTSMLMALLGEMHCIPLSPRSMVSLPRDKGVAYHAQESWVLNDTIRNNILFGSEYDEERYNKVLEQCALKRDLGLFDAGDQTEVGEKGITLSGGQKARITLARAIYSSAEILLLDDVLAALDVHTSRWIVEKCLQGDLVRGRTVILVTHNIALTAPVSDFVVSLGSDGRVLSQGSLSSALAKDSKLASEVQKESAQIEKAEEEIDEVKPDEEARKAAGKLTIAEEISEGHVGWSALTLFFYNMGKGKWLYLFWLSYLGTIFFSKLSNIIETWVLGLWAQQYDIHHEHPEEVHIARYLALYISVSLTTIALSSIGYVVYVFGTIRASRVIHQRLIEAVLGSTLRWLDKTPSARIITRCTQDIESIDGAITNYLYPLVEFTFELLLKFGALVFMSPYALLPAIIFWVAEGIFGQAYMKAQLPVKREMSNAKSPVLAHFASAVAGLVSIRAYGAQSAFKQESFTKIDRYTRVARTYWNLNRWFGIRGDTLGGIFTFCVAAYLVYGSSHFNASDTGFSLTMALGVCNLLMWWVRFFNEFEVSGNSLERIQQYLEIEQEPRASQNGVPPAYWPASGDLRVEKLSARYSPDGPVVLNDLSFHIKSGERVGIVGRTGSGKSSLTLSLLRGILTQGKVYYDGLATDTINLDALRSHITIIPQVPELLTGTLRENLDPFSQHDDAVLNDALHASGLYSLQSDDDEGRLTLDSTISGGGSNLSVGQRQIIALARALVRQSKLLILDEATSAIDYKTDTIIQASLRKQVRKDVTLLTVAHRLQTIMDSDKIMVLDAGRIVEYGSPTELLDDEQGFLRGLVDASGDRDVLYEMAKSSVAI